MDTQCPSSFDIYLGDDVQQILGVELNGTPVDLTDASNIQIIFPNDPNLVPNYNVNPTYTASLTGGQIAVNSPSILGQFTLNLPNAFTQYFQIQEGFNVDIIVTIAGIINTYRIFQGANIRRRSPFNT